MATLREVAEHHREGGGDLVSAEHPVRPMARRQAEERIVHPGDLFIWAVPNAGNPQKVQRYLSDWAIALREMAGLGAEIMVSGHGLPVFGADRISTALTDTADLLDSIETQVLALMNTGAALDTVLHEVAVPARLRDRPYLRPVYDRPQFLVRNVWRRYGGWYDGEPDQLLPAPRSQQAQMWVDLAGGLAGVLRRAAELADAGDLRMACHLVEYAVLAELGSDQAHQARADVYSRRATGRVECRCTSPNRRPDARRSPVGCPRASGATAAQSHRDP